MRPDPVCPRCAGPVRPPGLWTSAWRCERHGDVYPFAVLPRVAPEAVEHVTRLARVPVWAPRPLPHGWLMTGVGLAGDERSGGRASALACAGPAPLGGGADLVLVAEEPGVGLGSRFAGLSAPDPGQDFDRDPPHAKIEAAGHPTPLWSLPTAAADRAVYVGEAKGLWLWAVLWPASAGVLLLEDVILRDLREEPGGPGMDFGALSPRLTEHPALG